MSRELLNKNLAQMLKGGVIMDVTTTGGISSTKCWSMCSNGT